MKTWSSRLSSDPIKPLLDSQHEAIVYFTRRDLLMQSVKPVDTLWKFEEPQKILAKMKPEGFWKSKTANRSKAPAVNYDLFETFKNFSILIDMYEFNRNHKSIDKAAEYLFSCQTDEGDFRGIIGNQYAPYYTGLIMSHLIKAGYQDDPRIEKGFQWLLTMRQNDGGWIIGSPGCFGKYDKEERATLTSTIKETKQDFDWNKPFAHSGTGMVLRAFALHDKYKKSIEAKKAAQLLKSHFFKKDNYSSYQHKDNWVNFKFPFFWTDLVSALDSVMRINLDKNDDEVLNAVKWFIDNQEESGLWKHSYSRIHSYIENEKIYEIQLWITLAICRILKKFLF